MLGIHDAGTLHSCMATNVRIAFLPVHLPHAWHGVQQIIAIILERCH